MSNIIQFSNVLNQETRDEICHFIDEYITRNDIQPYDHALLNCFAIRLEEIEFYQEMSVFKTLYNKCCIISKEYLLNIKEKHRHDFDSIVLSSIQLRKVVGPSLLHGDGVKPFLNKLKTTIYHRIGTVIVVLNDNNDVIYFPEQGASAPLTGNTAIIFPPYPMYLHNTSYGGIPRYIVLFWILATSDSEIDDVNPLV